MHLMPNQLYRLTTNAHGLAAGTYRIVVDDTIAESIYCVLIKPDTPPVKVRGGRPKIEALKRTKRFPKPPLVGSLHKVGRQDLLDLIESYELISLSLDLPGLYYTRIDQPSAANAFDKRCRIMEQFLDNEELKESVLIHGSLAGLVQEAVQKHKVSRSHV